MSFSKPILKVNAKWKIGVVTSRFNEEITYKLQVGAIAELKKNGIKDKQITAIDVPGAIEIPVITQKLFKRGASGVIALGAVIRGETTHYDYVCNSVERGCSTVALEFQKPVVFGVLTTEDEAQAHARTGGAQGHKGIEAAQVLIEMLTKLDGLTKK